MVNQPMSINPETGVIELSEIGAAISPSVSREVFLSTPAFKEASLIVRNEPWCSFDLPPIAQADTNLVIRVQFYGERLTEVSLSHSAPRFGNSWAEWSEERELERKAFHELWLARELRLPQGPFRWGDVRSCYDAKGCSSYIQIRYATAN